MPVMQPAMLSIAPKTFWDLVAATPAMTTRSGCLGITPDCRHVIVRLCFETKALRRTGKYLLVLSGWWLARRGLPLLEVETGTDRNHSRSDPYFCPRSNRARQGAQGEQKAINLLSPVLKRHGRSKERITLQPGLVRMDLQRACSCVSR
jgi:hypothetical protein